MARPPGVWVNDQENGSEWIAGARLAEEDKRDYSDKLEHSVGSEAFKYVFLINNASVEKYVQQSRQQSEPGFRLCQWIALGGFGLLTVSIAFGLVAEFTEHSLIAAYLAGLLGVFMELFAAVLFLMHNRTLQQINGFYQGLMSQQHEALIDNITQMSGQANLAQEGLEPVESAPTAPRITKHHN